MEIKKLENAYSKSTSFKKEILIDCKKRDLIKEYEEIVEQLNKIKEPIEDPRINEVENFMNLQKNVRNNNKRKF